MSDPYRVEAPAILAFSGGRTSGFLLKHVLDAYDGRLPDDILVAFENTGKERTETLAFVQECGQRWQVSIHWLEYRRQYLPKYKSKTAEEAARLARLAVGRTAVQRPVGVKEPGFVEVDYATAGRNGEPFSNMIEMMGLPTVLTRMCTQELKIRVAKKYMMALGYTEWWNVVGIRYDEPRRVARMVRHTGQRWENVLPLHDAKVTKAQVLAWWKEQPFDLQLPVDDTGETYGGNCDLCPLKAKHKRLRVMRENPETAAWWIEQEARTGMRFRDNAQSYATLAREAKAAPGDSAVCDVDDDLGDCVCHE